MGIAPMRADNLVCKREEEARPGFAGFKGTSSQSPQRPTRALLSYPPGSGGAPSISHAGGGRGTKADPSTLGCLPGLGEDVRGRRVLTDSGPGLSPLARK